MARGRRRTWVGTVLVLAAVLAVWLGSRSPEPTRDASAVRPPTGSIQQPALEGRGPDGSLGSVARAAIGTSRTTVEDSSPERTSLAEPEDRPRHRYRILRPDGSPLHGWFSKSMPWAFDGTDRRTMTTLHIPERDAPAWLSAAHHPWIEVEPHNPMGSEDLVFLSPLRIEFHVPDRTITLPRGVRVEGVLVDDDGDPLPPEAVQGVRIHVRCEESATPGTFQFALQTSAFAFQVPRGRNTLRVTPKGRWLGPAPLIVNAPASALRWVCPEGATLDVHLRCQGGTRDVRTAWLPEGHSRGTRHKMRSLTDGARISMPGCAPGQGILYIQSVEPPLAALELLDAVPVDGREIWLEPAAPFRVRLASVPADRPSGTLKIRVGRGRIQLGQVREDEGGIFVLPPLPWGRYWLSLHSSLVRGELARWEAVEPGHGVVELTIPGD